MAPAASSCNAFAIATFSSLFYQSTVLSSRAVDGHQMYSGGSVVGKASTIGMKISPTPPPIFIGGQKVRKLALFSTSHNCEPLALCSRQVWWSFIYAPLRTVCQSCPIAKIARRKRAKSSVTQRWIIRFRSNFVQSLITWQPKCCKSSRSRGERSRPQRDITCAKIRKIINTSAGYCSISLNFRTGRPQVAMHSQLLPCHVF